MLSVELTLSKQFLSLSKKWFILKGKITPDESKFCPFIVEFRKETKDTNFLSLAKREYFCNLDCLLEHQVLSEKELPLKEKKCLTRGVVYFFSF